MFDDEDEGRAWWDYRSPAAKVKNQIRLGFTDSVKVVAVSCAGVGKYLKAYEQNISLILGEEAEEESHLDKRVDRKCIAKAPYKTKMLF